MFISVYDWSKILTFSEKRRCLSSNYFQKFVKAAVNSSFSMSWKQVFRGSGSMLSTSPSTTCMIFKDFNIQDSSVNIDLILNQVHKLATVCDNNEWLRRSAWYPKTFLFHLIYHVLLYVLPGHDAFAFYMHCHYVALNTVCDNTDWLRSGLCY